MSSATRLAVALLFGRARRVGGEFSWLVRHRRLEGAWAVREFSPGAALGLEGGSARRCKTTLMPYRGRSVKTGANRIGCSGTGSSDHCRAMVASSSMLSSMANELPMQTRGPAPKGK